MSNNVCVYLSGPAGQTGGVTLSGPSGGLPATQSFTLDGKGEVLVIFNVSSAGTYNYTITRNQAGGTTTTKMGSVGVPERGNGPPPPAGFQQTPCPRPP